MALSACFGFANISCANKASNDKKYKQNIIDEFIGNESKNISGLTSVPRSCFYHDKIIPYLKQRIKDIANLSDEQIHVDDGGNIFWHTCH